MRFRRVDIDRGIAAVSSRGIVSTLAVVLLSACATTPRNAPTRSVARILSEARSPQVAVAKRAADYLQAAAVSVSDLGSGTEPTPARETYNAAAAELTILLRSREEGRLWGHPVTLGHYHLRFQPASYSVWSTDYFSRFILPADIEAKRIKYPETQDGVGGALVGVRSLTPPEYFAPKRGIPAPVTATLDFKGDDVTLTLRRPARQLSAPVDGAVRPLAADFSAPIAYHRPPFNLFWKGVMGTLRSSHYMEKTGLYFLQPYDPERIPVVFVHGLASTSYTWVQTIDGLLADPQVRKNYQFWVFNYATGNPVSYSALRLREELARVDKLFPNHRNYVLVGHSMGGILCHMQAITLTRGMWEQSLGETAREVFHRVSSNNLFVRGIVFRANPRVERVVFVCTPHRGSDLALGGIGRWGRSLIALPVLIRDALAETLRGVNLSDYTGAARRLPNSVTALSPKNPVLRIVNSARITAPYHSIIGDRGEGDTPNSTDGVVPYWSSRLEGAQSEAIVPGPHGSCALPETIKELDRILALHSSKRSPKRQLTVLSLR